ncbi:hypothetical protein [Mesorhizobium sp. CN2-181]|uniref:hypothetical protein n=1 Tax=Mesorhizobium yinganensis TaxID=3157707 RepID=UPI0032B7D3EA
MAGRYAWRDDRWESIKDLLPDRESDFGGTTKMTGCSRRRFCMPSGGDPIPRRDLPGRFGDFLVTHARRTRWSESGVWQNAFELLAPYSEDTMIARAQGHSAKEKGAGTQSHWGARTG